MTPTEHYAAAEALLEAANKEDLPYGTYDYRAQLLRRAQVHATLATAPETKRFSDRNQPMRSRQ